MWYPATWKDLETLLGEPESSSLDFKRQPTKNDETAKDIAAMTVNGGVLVYGMDEDKGTRLAAALLPFPIAGVEEKLHQVSGARTSPAPDIQIHVIVDPSDEANGIVAVVIPASAHAPHQANGRFPCRRGTRTGYLEEREIERLYRQRQELSGPTPKLGALIAADFVSVLDGFQVNDGTGVLRLVVRPAANDVSHPAGAWQRDALKSAVSNAIQRQGPRVGNNTLIKSFPALANWQPNGADGWWASNAGMSAARIAPPASTETLIAACLTYPACLSYQLFLGLRIAASEPTGDLRSAREVDLLYELVGLLAIAGEYFSEVAGGAHLLAELHIERFHDARSQMAMGSGSTADLEAAKMPGAPDTITQAARTGAAEIREKPERVARLLIERWLPAFYTDECDLFAWVVPPN